MAKVNKRTTRKTAKMGNNPVGLTVPKAIIKRYNTLMKNATAFGKLIGATV